MNYLPKVSLSSAQRPVLLEQEIVLYSIGKVGLYQDEVRLRDFDCGFCYITTHRLLWLHENTPDISIALSLDGVQSTLFYDGFFKSHPKITLFIKSSLETSGREKKSFSGGSGEALHQLEWICTVCQNSNTNDIKCTLCGVPKEKATKRPEEGKSTVTTCPRCTFINPPGESSCKMCYTPLQKPKTSTESLEARPTPDHNVATWKLKLSFRGSGYSETSKALNKALSDKMWEKIRRSSEGSSGTGAAQKALVGGIAGIMKHAEDTKKEAEQNLATAFEDLDALMTKAFEMVKLAESVSTKIAKANDATQSEKETFQNYMVSLGISSPVTKDGAGDLYHKDLARELSDFLTPILDKAGGMMSLVDVYCLYNRARGIAMISPEDLYKACMSLEVCGLPQHLKIFDSGFMVVCSTLASDEKVIERILRHIQQKGCVHEVDLAALENISFHLAKQQLLMAEHEGKVCRDSSHEGVFFYENKFMLS